MAKTDWNKDNFNFHGGYLGYMLNGHNEFIARFKYSGMLVTMGMFKKMLVKHYTPEEYLARLNAKHERWQDREAPLQILQNDGHITYGNDGNDYVVYLDGVEKKRLIGAAIRTA